ncbi:MAG TPA: PilZ domain-containing protein [bacterium]|nr:PilZ domain-containing protein [bacterium]
MELKSYFVLCNSNQYGPFTYDTLISYIQDGYFTENDYLWDDEKKEWRLMKYYEEFKDLFKFSEHTKSSEKSSKLEIPENLILKGTKIYYHNYRTGELQERAYKRLNIEIPAELKPLNHDKFEHIKVLNISAGGMGVELNKDLKLNLDDIATTRIFISSIAKYIELKSQIVRLRKIVMNRFDIGLKFLDLSTDDAKYFLNLLSWKAEYIEKSKK